MAKYGIDRALLAASRPETDQPASRIIDAPNPWARVKAHLLCGLGAAMRCQCILLSGSGPGARIHVFGYASDLERADLLYTSVLIQMSHGLAAAAMPEWCRSPRAWRRSWLLGFTTAVISRVRAAEQRAASRAIGSSAAPGSGVELVLADRHQVIGRTVRLAYPVTRKARVTYTGSGYSDGYAKGTQADLGTSRLPGTSPQALRGGQ